ncbi:hypothetical protein F1C76_14940 [Geodermatophilaceae bacterium NBWT11]|nr:hypothetical protein F1C76_14940 [Geodermatophilaceae bacterium NBWT11]
MATTSGTGLLGATVGLPLTRRGFLAAVALGTSAPLLGACSGGGDEPASSSVSGGNASSPAAVTTAADGTQEVTLVVNDDFVFLPDAFTVAPGPVRLTLSSEATQMTHNFLFSAGQGPAAITEEIPILGPGDEATIDFDVTAPGDYPFECSFHLALGQVGTMTVTSG